MECMDNFIKNTRDTVHNYFASLVEVGEPEDNLVSRQLDSQLARTIRQNMEMEQILIIIIIIPFYSTPPFYYYYYYLQGMLKGSHSHSKMDERTILMSPDELQSLAHDFMDNSNKLTVRNSRIISYPIISYPYLLIPYPFFCCYPNTNVDNGA